MNDEFSGKRLMEVLSEMDDETLIYLGAQSSFFDIATAGEMKQPGYINRLSNELREAAKTKAEQAKNRFIHALKHPPAWELKEENKSKENEEKSIDNYIKMISRWHTHLEEMRKFSNIAKTYEENFVPLQRRSVKDVYPRIDGTGICVIVYGNETGRYWFLSEKKSRKSAVVQYES